jgi:tetratricopeptide (TPR) repeat protein
MPFRNGIRHDVLIILFLIIATAAVYGQVWNFDFINYDDFSYVRDNVIVQKGLTWKGIQWAFTSISQANWHPLTWLSYMLECELFGLSPEVHHLVNLLFHLCNSILLFLVLKRMTGARWQSAFVAALFALHPLHVESVAWISERKDVLSTFFWILTMGAYVVYAERRDLKLYLLALLFFSLGLMAKSMVVTLPVVLLLMDYWPLQRLRFVHPGPVPASAPVAAAEATGKKQRKGKKEKKLPLTKAKEKRQGNPFFLVAAEKIPFVLLSALVSIMAIYTQKAGGAIASFTKLPLTDRIGSSFVSYALYLWKAVWPSALAVFYPFQFWSPLEILAGTLVLIALSVGVWWGRRFPYLTFGWLWYFVTLLPVIGLIKLGDAAMADRYTYIPLIGPFVALAWGAGDFAKRLALPKFLLPAAAGGILGACMIVTYLYLGQWKDSLTLFTHTLNVTQKNFLAHNNIATAYIDQRRYEEALAHLDQALTIRANFIEAYFNKGIVLYNLGKNDEAIAYFKKTLEMDPRFSDASYELGDIYLSRGDADNAITHFGRAIRTTEPRPKAYAGLAEAFILKGNIDEALSYSLRALEWRPGDAKLHYNIANINIHKGRLDEAIAYYKNAVRIKPDYSKAHNNLGSALMLQNKVDEAIVHFQEAVRFDRDYKMARENLRDALAQKKKLGT